MSVPEYIFFILWVLSLSICWNFLQRIFSQGTVSPIDCYFPVLQFLTSPVPAVMANSCPRGCTKGHCATRQWSQRSRQGSTLPSLIPTATTGTCQGLPILLLAGGEQPIKEDWVCFHFSSPRNFAKSQCQAWLQPKMGGEEMLTTCKWWKCSLFIYTPEEGWRG